MVVPTVLWVLWRLCLIHNFRVFRGRSFFFFLFLLLFVFFDVGVPPTKEEKESMKSTCGSRLGSTWEISDDWKFPETPAEKKSMSVFEDLWAKGLCAVSGSNYGADYVVYDGEGKWEV